MSDAQQPDPCSAEAALQTVRTLHCIILNGDEDRWITRDTAQAWLNELRAVEHHLRQAAVVEVERDQLRAENAQQLATLTELAPLSTATQRDEAREIARIFIRYTGTPCARWLFARDGRDDDALPAWLTDDPQEATR